MPTVDSVFTRVWKFVDQFAAGDQITRTAADVSADDLAAGIQAALDRAEALSVEIDTALAPSYRPERPDTRIVSDGNLSQVEIPGLYPSRDHIFLYIGGVLQPARAGFYSVTVGEDTTVVSFDIVPVDVEVDYIAMRQIATPVADADAIDMPDGSTALDLWWGNRVFPDLATFNAATIPAAVTAVWVLSSGIVLRYQREAAAAYTGVKAGWVPAGAIFDLHFGAVTDYEDTGDTGTDNLSAINNATAYAATVGEYVWITGPSMVSGPVVIPDGCRGLKGTRPPGSSIDQAAAPAWPSGYPLGSAIIGNHTAGPVVHIQHSDQWVIDLEIGATATRQPAAATTGTGNINCGLLLEATDTGSSDQIQRCGGIGNVIRNQPTEGWFLCGKSSSIDMINNSEINCGRHGFMVDNGQTAGRTNKYRPGIVTIRGDRQTNLDGHQFKIGHESAGTDQPFRVLIERSEGIRCGNDVSLLTTSAACYILGEQITIINTAQAATNGTSGETATHDHVYAIGGKGNSIIGSRAIRCVAEYVDILTSPWSSDGDYSSLKISGLHGATSASPPANMIEHNGVDVDLYLDNLSGNFSGYPFDTSGFVGSAIVDYEGVVQYHSNTFKPDVFQPQGLSTFTAQTNFQGPFVFSIGSTLTISTGAITVTRTYHGVFSEGGTGVADDLATINGGVNGQIIILRTSDSTAPITVKNGTGNIVCGADRVLSHNHDRITLQYDGTNWCMIAFADNA